jgi:hypothetical protein
MLFRPCLVVALLFAAACASPGGGRQPAGRDAMAGPSPVRRSPDSSAGNSGDPSDVAVLPPADALSPEKDAAGAGTAPDQGAVPPEPPPATAGALETIRVRGGGTPVTFQTLLVAGEIYLLKATGSVELSPGQFSDAEYRFGTGDPADEFAGVDIGVNIRMKQIHRFVHYTPTPPGPGRMKWSGYRDDHTYYMTVTGEGAALTLSLEHTPGITLRGEIAVSLFPLSPAPPKLEKELETVMIPITKTIVSSTMTTTAGKVYLLQASGAGKVGGGGLKLGDAEYMDWDAEGNRRNEGEAGADFGIGVDETSYVKMSGAAYTPRMRWWGLWRKDHTYYLLFTGTGKPIQFLYHDSGYGDNSPTDQLSVRIFAAP